MKFPRFSRGIIIYVGVLQSRCLGQHEAGGALEGQGAGGRVSRRRLSPEDRP